PGCDDREMPGSGIRFASARTAEKDPAAAAEALVAGLGAALGEPKLVTVFASWDRDQRALNRALRERLPRGTRLVGATTAGELARDGRDGGTVVAGGFAGGLEVGLGLGKGLTRDAIGAGLEAMRAASADLGIKPADLDRKTHIGLVIDDGPRMKKEELLIGM